MVTIEEYVYKHENLSFINTNSFFYMDLSFILISEILFYFTLI